MPTDTSRTRVADRPSDTHRSIASKASINQITVCTAPHPPHPPHRHTHRQKPKTTCMTHTTARGEGTLARREEKTRQDRKQGTKNHIIYLPLSPSSSDRQTDRQTVKAQRSKQGGNKGGIDPYIQPSAESTGSAPLPSRSHGTAPHRTAPQHSTRRRARILSSTSCGEKCKNHIQSTIYSHCRGRGHGARTRMRLHHCLSMYCSITVATPTLRYNLIQTHACVECRSFLCLARPGAMDDR